MMKKSFSKECKKSKQFYTNILQPFEFLLTKTFAYSFAVKKIEFGLTSEIFDFKKRLTFEYKYYKMKKCILLSFLTFSFIINAQIGTSTPLGGENSKWTFGGSAGLGGSFGGGGGTSVYLSPRVGYKVTENLETGLAGSFTWASSKYYSSTTTGVGPFLNYYIARNFYISGLFQEYFFNQKNKYDNVKYSGNEAALYLGGGYMQRIGDRAYMQIGGMYNVLYRKDKSVFGGGFVPSVGVVFGL